MREFFQGWRRKIGCVTLVMASVLANVWVRSYFVADRLAFTRSGFRYAVVLSPGCVGCDHWINEPPVQGIGWSSGRRNLNSPVQSRPAYYKAPLESVLGKLQFESRFYPLWPIVVPLTLVSGCLVLWKPRVRR